MIQELQYLSPFGNSDYISMSFRITHTQQINIPPSYNLFKTNYKAIQEDLRCHDWKGILKYIFDNDYSTFTNMLKALMKDHTLLKPQLKPKRFIYLTKDAIRLKNTKRRCWIRYVSTGTDHDRRIYTRGGKTTFKV